MSEHYYTIKPSSEHALRTLSYSVAGKTLSFLSDSSVFSKAHVDDGTHLLIETVLEQEAEGAAVRTALDLGTGYGVIGISLAATLDMPFTLSDVNERALELAQQNAVRNGVSEKITVLKSDGFDAITDSFDLIVSNPPIRIGKARLQAMWAEAYEHLRPGGRFYLVIRRAQGAETALAYLQQLTGEAAAIRKKKGFWILCAVRGKDD